MAWRDVDARVCLVPAREGGVGFALDCSQVTGDEREDAGDLGLAVWWFALVSLKNRRNKELGGRRGANRGEVPLEVSNCLTPT